ncbi:MAG: Cof-type HAD-IIB family hydrolase [bacterium]
MSEINNKTGISKRNYKAIFLDLDDTLLLPNGSISIQTKSALKKAQENNIKVVLASGRPTGGMTKIIKELELEKSDNFIISFNGGRISNTKTNEVVFEDCLSKKQMLSLYDLSQKHECNINTYTENNKILANQESPYTYIEAEINGFDLDINENFTEVMPEKCIKAILMQAPEHLKEVEGVLKPNISGMSMVMSKPFFLEFMNEGIDKGSSIKKLCEILEIPIEDTIAFGDSYNDETMLKAVGCGVAMGNAVDYIKKIADFIADTNENDGVAQVINNYLLK